MCTNWTIIAVDVAGGFAHGRGIIRPYRMIKYDHFLRTDLKSENLAELLVVNVTPMLLRLKTGDSRRELDEGNTVSIKGDIVTSSHIAEIDFGWYEDRRNDLALHSTSINVKCLFLILFDVIVHRCCCLHVIGLAVPNILRALAHPKDVGVCGVCAS